MYRSYQKIRVTIGIEFVLSLKAKENSYALWFIQEISTHSEQKIREQYSFSTKVMKMRDQTFYTFKNIM